MKPTGIIRRIDDLGRIVIPKEIRRTMHIVEGDALELYLEENAVCFMKYDCSNDVAQMLKGVSSAILELNCPTSKQYSFIKSLNKLQAEIEAAVEENS